MKLQESLVPVTEEMLSAGNEPHGSAVASLLRQFPDIAELLREATGFSSVEPTAELPESEAAGRPLDETEPHDANGMPSRSEATGTLARGLCARYLPALRGRPQASALSSD